MNAIPLGPGTVGPLLQALALSTLLGTTRTPAAEPPATSTRTQTIGAHTFTLPEGFRIEAVAKTDQVARPVNGSLDDRGRLYVTDSSGSTEPRRPRRKTRNGA